MAHELHPKYQLPEALDRVIKGIIESIKSPQIWTKTKTHKNKTTTTEKKIITVPAGTSSHINCSFKRPSTRTKKKTKIQQQQQHPYIGKCPMSTYLPFRRLPYFFFSFSLPLFCCFWPSYMCVQFFYFLIYCQTQLDGHATQTHTRR